MLYCRHQRTGERIKALPPRRKLIASFVYIYKSLLSMSMESLIDKTSVGARYTLQLQSAFRRREVIGSSL
nr:MAG TPA: hypothetical protein [Caudoviricetes sp.]